MREIDKGDGWTIREFPGESATDGVRFYFYSQGRQSGGSSGSAGSQEWKDHDPLFGGGDYQADCLNREDLSHGVPQKSRSVYSES